MAKKKAKSKAGQSAAGKDKHANPNSVLALRGDTTKTKSSTRGKEQKAKIVRGEVKLGDQDILPKDDKRMKQRSIQEYKLKSGESRKNGKRKTQSRIANPEAAVNRILDKFSDQSFIKDGQGASSTLMCQACQQRVVPDAFTVKVHIYGQKGVVSANTPTIKHQVNLKQLNKRQAHNPLITNSLTKFDALFNPVGTTLPDQHRSQKVKALMTLLEAGIPINKLQTPGFKHAMEKAFGTPLSPSHLPDFMPVVRDVQKAELGAELSDGDLFSAFFDCAFRFANTFCFVVRKWIANRPQHRLICLHLTGHSLTSVEQAGLIATSAVTSVAPPLPINKMILGHADSCGVNIGTWPLLQPVLHPGADLVLCKSHLFSNSGKEVAAPHVKDLVQCMTAFQVSGNAKAIFMTVYGQQMAGHNDIRWYCEFEQAHQQFLNYPVISTYVQQLTANGVCPATTTKLSALLAQHGPELKQQLAVYVEGMLPFVQATYKTETDSADAVFELFETVEGLREHMRICRGHHPTNLGLPNTRAVARDHVSQQNPGFAAVQIDGLVNAVVAQQRLVLEPAFQYFERNFQVGLGAHANNLALFDVARHFHPGLMVILQWSGPTLFNKLQSVRFLDTSNPDPLLRAAPVVNEAAAYLALAQGRNVTRATDTVGYVAQRSARLANDTVYVQVLDGSRSGRRSSRNSKGCTRNYVGCAIFRGRREGFFDLQRPLWPPTISRTRRLRVCCHSAQMQCKLQRILASITLLALNAASQTRT
jgi:hypothetical protein